MAGKKLQVSSNIQKLWKQTCLARKNSYSPYSKYAVGAAVETLNGKVFTGCNVENASYGGTVCAERVAFLKAVSEGHKKFKRVMVVVKAGAKKVAPCALCLQTMAEFCEPEMEIWLATSQGINNVVHFGDLLTLPFGPKDLL